jgi:very-short-patch-repair endonuclease
VHAEPGKIVAGHRLDLSVERDGVRLDVECDGAPFHVDARRDEVRDANIELQGWKVIRFSGRELSRNVDACADTVVAALKGQGGTPIS